MSLVEFTVTRNTQKNVINSEGFLENVGNNVPGFEYKRELIVVFDDPESDSDEIEEVFTYRGALIEPASTNLCKQSEDINTSWTPTSATPTQSTETTPDGDTTNKYIKLVDDGSTGTGQVRIIQSITVSANTKYTASVFLKADQLTFARLGAFNYDGSTDAFQYFELSGDGSLGTPDAGIENSKIEAYPNGWYRCSITWTNATDPSGFAFGVNLANSISTFEVPLDGTSSVFVWGAQLEESPIATSYIPTTTGAVTRVKDDTYLTSASSLIGQTEGTLFVEVDWQGTGQDQVIFDISDGSNNNRLAIYNDDSPVELRMIARANSVQLTQQGASSTAFTGIQKIAFAYKTNDFELYRNGSSISTDTSGSLASLATLTNVDFGAADIGSGSVSNANMWIRAVALFTTRLSDAECEALTTL